MNAPQSSRLPTYFVSHGGGPWPWMMDMMPGKNDKLVAGLQRVPAEIGRPRAILAISGHWEAPEFTVQTSAAPPMIYDYGGFPPHTYQIQYPAPGAPDVAARAGQLLDDAGITVRYDAQRGYDHGTFVPFFVMYPEADVPIVQLSMRHGYDPEAHLAVGRALAPLREEGVLIVGSGSSYHNLRMLGAAGTHPSREFGGWLTDAVVGARGAERSRLLAGWESAPSFRAAHPQEDHLVPLLVAVGAAEEEPAERIYHEPDYMGVIESSSYRIGELPG